MGLSLFCTLIEAACPFTLLTYSREISQDRNTDSTVSFTLYDKREMDTSRNVAGAARIERYYMWFTIFFVYGNLPVLVSRHYVQLKWRTMFYFKNAWVQYSPVNSHTNIFTLTFVNRGELCARQLCELARVKLSGLHCIQTYHVILSQNVFVFLYIKISLNFTVSVTADWDEKMGKSISSFLTWTELVYVNRRSDIEAQTRRNNSLITV